MLLPSCLVWLVPLRRGFLLAVWCALILGLPWCSWRGACPDLLSLLCLLASRFGPLLACLVPSCRVGWVLLHPCWVLASLVGWVVACVVAFGCDMHGRIWTGWTWMDQGPQSVPRPRAPQAMGCHQACSHRCRSSLAALEQLNLQVRPASLLRVAVFGVGCVHVLLPCHS